MPLRFHWRLVLGGEGQSRPRDALAGRAPASLPDLPAQIEFCLRAEEAGIDSLLTDFGRHTADPIVLAAALGPAVERVGFIVAYRSGLITPVSFVQQINTLSAILPGRVALNIVAGYSPEEQRSYGDFLSHDERYARTADFLSVCHALWRDEGPVDHEGRYFRVEKAHIGTPFTGNGRRCPEILVAGSSSAAMALAAEQGSCWMRLGDTPERVARDAAPFRERGMDVGLRLSIIVRPTREEAHREAERIAVEASAWAASLAYEKRFVSSTDSVSIKATFDLAEKDWLTPTLWSGAVRTYGAPALALVGSPDDIASALLEYGDAGVTQFILSGWPKRQTMIDFGREVIPIVRRRESARR